MNRYHLSKKKRITIVALCRRQSNSRKALRILKADRYAFEDNSIEQLLNHSVSFVLFFNERIKEQDKGKKNLRY